MTKKREKGKVSEKVRMKNNKDVLIENLLVEANTAMQRIDKLEKRIDTIVAAIDASKKVKGL